MPNVLSESNSPSVWCAYSSKKFFSLNLREKPRTAIWLDTWTLVPARTFEHCYREDAIPVVQPTASRVLSLTSALQVLHIMRYINRVTTLLGKSFSMTFQDQPKLISMTYWHYNFPEINETWHMNAYTLTAHIYYRISQCTCKNFWYYARIFNDFSMTFHDFPWPLLFSMTIQAWNMVFLNSMTFQAQWSAWINLRLTEN